MTVLMRLGADKRPKFYTAHVYGAFAHLYSFGEHVDTISAAQAEAGREAYEAERLRWQREGE